MLEYFLNLDTQLFLWLNSFHSPAFDRIMWFVSGKIEWLPFYLILFGYLVYTYRWKSIALIVAIALAVTLADQLAVKAFKEVFQRPRPTHNAEIGHLVYVVNNYRGGAFGFVSNHAANTFALASFLALFFRNRYFSTGIFLWAVFVSYSRIYLGVHYPADVVGGALLGMFIGFLIYTVYRYTGNRWGFAVSGSKEIH